MKYLVLLFTDLYGSFKNAPGGFSARKCTAFAAVCVAAYETYVHTNPFNLTTVILIWLGIAMLCLGIITMEQVIRFKENGNSNREEGRKGR